MSHLLNDNYKIKNMKKISIKSLSVMAAITFSAMVTSCSDDDVVPASSTITDVVVNSSDFSRLEEAVLKANLQGTLSSTGPFTVFAPDNNAFDASGISSATIASMTASDVASVLLYHTLGAKVMAADVPMGPNAKVVTAGGDSVFITKNSAGVFINGIPVTPADIAASNGVIHRVNKVLLPASGDLVATAQAPGSGLDSLVMAVVRANNAPGGNPNLIATLQNTTLTLFAPTNAAFTQLLNALSISDINQIPVATLLAVLQYHLLPGRAFSSDLTNGNVTMLANGTATINLSNGTGGGPTITGSGNGSSSSNIMMTNILARNGVVHVIDRVLLP